MFSASASRQASSLEAHTFYVHYFIHQGFTVVLMLFQADADGYGNIILLQIYLTKEHQFIFKVSLTSNRCDILSNKTKCTYFNKEGNVNPAICTCYQLKKETSKH